MEQIKETILHGIIPFMDYSIVDKEKRKLPQSGALRELGKKFVSNMIT